MTNPMEEDVVRTPLDPSIDETLKAAIFDTPTTNQTKVEFIKDELTAGRYEIDSRRIAEKLVEFSKEKESIEGTLEPVPEIA